MSGNKRYYKRIAIICIIVFMLLLSIFNGINSGYNTIEEKEENNKGIYINNITTENIDINKKARYEIQNAKITVYTPYSDGGKWGYETATGVKSQHLSTCAVDPSIIPLGSKITVNGLELTAVDTGNKVKGNTIDIFYNGTEKQAKEFIKKFGNLHTIYYY